MKPIQKCFSKNEISNEEAREISLKFRELVDSNKNEYIANELVQNIIYPNSHT